MKNRIYQIILGFIIIAAVFFRFYDLAVAPPSPTVDEVSIGYNAFSILQTGADEYGNKFPILLRAYDDWRPAPYIYLVMPFVALIGLDVASVRLPAAILSTISVIAVYFLLKEWFKNSKLKLAIGNLKFEIPEVATLLFALSPWHIYISRFGHEVNASYAFFVFGLLFFFRFINGKKWNLFISALFFALSFDSYQSTKIVVPLVILVLTLLYFKKIIADKRTLVISALIGFIVALPIIVTLFDQNALLRFKGTSLLSTSESYFEKSSARLAQDRFYGDILGKLYDNNKVSSLTLLSHAYLSHLDPVWLFVNHGGEQFKAPTMGLLYLFEFPLILLGLIFLGKSGISRKIVIFILLWGLIAIIPGAITNGYAHPMRVFNLLPIPQILSGIGLINIYIYLSPKLKKLFLTLFVICLLGFVVWFFHSYFTLMPRELSKHFQYGVLGALEYTSSIDQSYDRVIVSNEDRLFESYMFYLYLHKYDPSKYQSGGGTKSGGFAEPHTIGKYTFVDVNDKLYPDTLYVLNPDEVRKFHNISKKILKRIYLRDGSLAIVVLETK